MAEIFITFDKLTRIVGVIESLAIQEFLEDPSCSVTVGNVTLKGSTIWRRIEQKENIPINDPKVIALIDLLADMGAMSAEVRQRIADYVAAQSIEIVPPVSAPPFAHSYRIPLPLIADMPEGPVNWATKHLTAYGAVWVEGGYIQIRTDGNCTAPGTEVV